MLNPIFVGLTFDNLGRLAWCGRMSVLGDEHGLLCLDEDDAVSLRGM